MMKSSVICYLLLYHSGCGSHNLRGVASVLKLKVGTYVYIMWVYIDTVVGFLIPRSNHLNFRL